ncbi:PspC domain-containing protein [Sporichthya brevicatena]
MTSSMFSRLACGYPELPGPDPEIVPGGGLPGPGRARVRPGYPDPLARVTIIDVDTSTFGLDTGSPLGPAADGSPRTRYRRRRENRLVAGVAGGMADHLGLDPLHVRVAFAVMSGIAGFGVVLYGAFWLVVPLSEPSAAAEPPGLAAASRRGLRRLPARGPEPESIGQLVALLAVALGAVLALQQTGLGVDETVLWPALAVIAGLAVVWWQVDEADRSARTADAPAPSSWRRRVLVGIRFVAGGVLVTLGLATYLVLAGGPGGVRRGVLGAVVLLGGAALLVGPWVLRTWRSLADERAERIRSQMHADLAAHLHDSVLQTLALIQRQAHDPREVMRLARGQERDLREFLYGDRDTAQDVSTLAAALRRTAAEVEEAHRVPVEVVTVGDADLDGPAADARRALLAAAREAMVNAAVHAGTTVDVYAEVDGDTVVAYVRDRGPGFDPDAVPEDRAGVRHSIVGRMQRHGGRAVVRSRAGEGTEVELRLGES